MFQATEKAVRILVEGQAASPSIEPVDVSKGISTLLWGLALIAGVPIAFFAVRRLLRAIAMKKMKSYTEDLINEAAGYEKAGRFVSAGLAYEKLKDPARAASMYSRGKDYKRAAKLYESLMMPEAAREMFEKAGDLDSAAEVAVSAGQYAEAAKLYKQMGKPLKAAEAFEGGGSRLAAAREYREGGDYVKAAELLGESGMNKEAAEMYKISLKGEEINASNIDSYYKYALYLEEAGEAGEAESVLKMVLGVDPGYKDVSERLGRKGPEGQMPEVVREAPRPEADIFEPTAHAMEPPPAEASPAEPRPVKTEQFTEEPLIKETTLRAMSKAATPMEPRYALRLWVSVLKALGRRHKEGVFFGGLVPENIFIDPDNNVRFGDPGTAGPTQSAYQAPEVLGGRQADEGSDIYSMGMVLYEMLTGSLQNAGLNKPSEISPEVPQWLDEITLRCVDKDPSRRYRSLDEIFSALKGIKRQSGE